jgi:CelD/BcsL family acetyltransferase involved in cellulose biosynthesis
MPFRLSAASLLKACASPIGALFLRFTRIFILSDLLMGLFSQCDPERNRGLIDEHQPPGIEFELSAPPAPPRGQLALDVLHSPEALAPHEAAWAALVPHRDADPDFYRFFLSTRPGASPYVLALRDAEGASFLVGRLERVRLGGRIGYVGVPSPRLRVLELIHGGMLGDVATRHAPAAIVHLRGLLRGAEVDAIRLHYAEADTAFFAAFAELRGALARRRPVLPVAHRRRAVDSGPSSFAESISRNERSNQRRREKRLLAEYGGDVRIACRESAASVPQLMQDAEHVAARSYQRGLGVGFSDGEQTRQRLMLYAERQWLRGWILHLGGAPAALWIGAAHAGTFFSDYLAYDARLSALAPGTYLTMKVLEELQDRRPDIRLVDFGPGDAPYKARFGTQVRMVATLDVFAPTLPGVCADVLQTGTDLTAALARAALRRLGVLDRVKRRLRQRSTVVAESD